MLSDPEEFMNHYVENIEHITLLGNGNEKLSKVDKKVEILEETNKELEDKLADLKERHDKQAKELNTLRVNFLSELSDIRKD